MTDTMLSPDLATIKISIDAEPYKSKGVRTYRLNASGGKLFEFDNGRKPVRPIMECEAPATIRWNNQEITVPKGTWRLNDVLFKEGHNELYINSLSMFDTHWYDLEEGGSNQMTWEQATKYRWDELVRINLNDGDIPHSWSDISHLTWDDLAGKRWDELDWRPSTISSGSVYLSYEWKDL